MGNSKHNPYSAPLGNKLPILPPHLSLTPLFPDQYWESDSSLGAGGADSPPNGVNRRAKNHEEYKAPDSAPISTCQPDQMATGLAQGPLKSVQIFELISVALDQHLCTQMKVSFFYPKRVKVMFSFRREKGSADIIFPAVLLGQSI